ncbi:hypothetical protein SNE40_015918 [Patella caerulea]|uniref:Uncharacterized protein n=1 Tax=Patella caerulea TaxID=87958 RepID=A0AAN8JC27_PATCE
MLNWMKKRCRRRSTRSSVVGMKCEGGKTDEGHGLPASPLYVTLEEEKDISSVSDICLNDDIYEDVSDVIEKCAPRHSVFSNKEVDLKNKKICPICRSDVALERACSCLDPESKSHDVYFEIYAEPIYNRYVNDKQECISCDDNSGYYESFVSDFDSTDKQINSCNDSQNDVGHMTLDESDSGYEEIEFKPNAINNKLRYSLSSPPLTSSPRFILSVIREKRLSRTKTRKGSLF